MVVKIVTDSTSDLPRVIVESLDITVIPLKVNFGTQVYSDGIDISADEFYDRMSKSAVLPTSSTPSIGDFAEAYTRLGHQADGIVSIHISAKLSGTYNCAVQGKAEAKTSCPIEVIDSYQASMGIGIIVMLAAQAARDGKSMADIIRIAKEAILKTECYALFDTLEYLNKGGRIGKAQALLGNILNIKPMIVIKEGEVHEFGRARTFNKGVARLLETVKEATPVSHVFTIYSTQPDVANQMADELRTSLPPTTYVATTRFGSVIGVYAGPGAVGVGFIRINPIK